MKILGRFGMPLVKLLLFVLLLMIFLLLLAEETPELMQVSRTMAATVLTYIVSYFMLLPIYGGYSFGERNRRVTASAILIITYFADSLAFAQLIIITSGEYMSTGFRFDGIGNLLFAMALQGVAILAATELGTRLYCKGHADMKVLFITDEQLESEKLKKAICKSLQRTELDMTVDYQDTDMARIMADYDTVFVSDVPYARRQELIELAYSMNKNIFFTPEICDVIEITSEHRMYDDRLVLKSPRTELSIWQRITKRCCDIVLSIIFMVLLSPVYLICAIYIKLEDGGDILFRQKRATKGGRPFTIYKFRTMKESTETLPVRENDDRITKAGKKLRKARLDELPQFINVLRGDMSLVGPRPEQLEYLHGFEKNYKEYEYRLRVKAGLTGYAQIEGKYNTTNKEKLILDLIYIQDYSLWLDMKLIFQTVLVFFKDDSTEGF